MTAIINASNTSGITFTSDTSGNLALQSNGTTVATITGSGANAGIQVGSTFAPTFSYYQSNQQTIPAATATKITFTSSEWDTTGGMYASSRFTPTIAGYYQINAGFASSTGTGRYYIYVYKNGAAYKSGVDSPTMYAPIVSALVYCNGSTDYVEIYGYSSAGDSFIATAPRTYFQGCYMRSA